MDGSVISKEQLETLLRSMQNSVPLSKISIECNNAKSINIYDKQNLYLNILDTINNSADSKSAALSIIQDIICLVNNKIELLEETFTVTENETSAPSKQSKFFHRVG